MKRLWALIVLGAIAFGIGLPSSVVGQKRSRATAVTRKARDTQLGSVEQFKEAFRADAGKVRLVALISPT